MLEEWCRIVSYSGDDADKEPAWKHPGAEPIASADKWALVALAASLAMLIGQIPVVNCLMTPLLTLIVGGVALTRAKEATNLHRARRYGWIATGIGLLEVVIIGGAVVFFIDNVVTGKLALCRLCELLFVVKEEKLCPQH